MGLVWYIYLAFGLFLMVHVGKYTVRPMDPSWVTRTGVSAVQQRPECIEEPFSPQLERENQQTWAFLKVSELTQLTHVPLKEGHKKKKKKS